MILRLCVLLTLAATTLVCGSALAGERVGWAVGIDSYQHAKSLNNAVSATEAIVGSLEACGFELATLFDCELDDLSKGFGRFLERSKGAEMRVIYFSGHGVESGGVNYLLPADASGESKRELAGKSASLNRWIDSLSASRAEGAIDLIILDCCRSDPFEEGRRGAGIPPVPDHTVLLFAAQPGEVAFDAPLRGERVGKPVSPFTLALVEGLATPHDDLFSFFGAVTEMVKADTKGKQEPYIKLSGNISTLQRARIRVVKEGRPRPGTLSPWVFPHSGYTRLTHEEVSGLNADRLWKARNEIYARRGYRFKSEKGRSYAAGLGSFYRPLKDEVDHDMSEIERENIALLGRFEKAINSGGAVRPPAPRGVWLFPNSSERRLTPADLAPLSTARRWVARNEIFARRGLIFQSARGKALCRHLGAAYRPVSADQTVIYSRLNAIEEANVELIGRLELGLAAPAAPAAVEPRASGPWLFPRSHLRLLTDAELSRLSATQLRWARNEIYARRGYIFSGAFGKSLTRELGAHYRPVTRDMESVESAMNSYEKANIARILRHEK